MFLFSALRRQRRDLVVHFQRLDKNQDGSLLLGFTFAFTTVTSLRSLGELSGVLTSASDSALVKRQSKSDCFQALPGMMLTEMAPLEARQR